MSITTKITYPKDTFWSKREITVTELASWRERDVVYFTADGYRVESYIGGWLVFAGSEARLSKAEGGGGWWRSSSARNLDRAKAQIEYMRTHTQDGDPR